LAVRVRAALNDISLAQSVPPERLSKILSPTGQWRPFPPIADRTGWAALPEATRVLLLQSGIAASTNPLPSLPATLYLDYARVGNRSRFEAEHRARREMLHAMVLAECVEAKGRFLDAIGNAVWAVCEESSWCYPAHIAVQKAGVGLPDVTEPTVDLFAGETAVSLAWTRYLLGTQLDRVSKRILPRIDFEIQHRILSPVLERDFGWMGFDRSGRSRPNNWNPWINASVLTATLIIETNAERRVRLVHKVLRSLDCFLQPYPSDGSCDEGPGYWGHAGGSLLDCLELLHSATDGRSDVFTDPLIQNIGRFFHRAHIAGDWFVAIGDCSARLDFDRALVFRYGQRIGDPHLKSLAAAGATPESIFESAGGRYLGRQLWSVFRASAILGHQPATEPLVRDVWLESEDMQLMTARTRSGSPEGLFVAAWGGHNAQSHNHNDVGNVIVFADGQPVLVDVGAPTYTAQTFSSRRYTIWAFQSAFHNLPTINGAMQEAGRRHAARGVSYRSTGAFAELVLDLAAAYPEEAKVESWLRTVRLDRGRNVEITDRFKLSEVSGVTTENLITPRDAVSEASGVLNLTSRDGLGDRPAVVRIEFDAAKLKARVERIELDDARLVKVWGDRLNRIILSPVNAVTSDTWVMRIGRGSQ
jgi:hypothetical protein